MKNIPQKIYLQTGVKGDDANIDFKELSIGDVTWHLDDVHGNDLIFVHESKLAQEAIEFTEWKDKNYMQHPDLKYFLKTDIEKHLRPYFTLEQLYLIFKNR